MGGLRKYMPITWITFLLGSLALIAMPFFAGFYSKDSIIEAVAESHLWGSGFAYYAVLGGVFVTAFYSFRLYFLVFHGKERYDQPPAAHDPSEEPDAHHDDHHAPHESPWVVTVPLILLAIPSVVIGYLTIGPLLYGNIFKDSIFINLERHPVMQEMAAMFHGPVQMALHSFTTAPFWLAMTGVALSYYMYIVNPALPASIRRKVQPIYTLLENKYYLDWFNENVVMRGTRGLGVLLWKVGDEKLIDGVLVNGSWKVVGWVSGVVRRLQSGYIYHYAFGMIIGVFVLMTYFVWLNR